MIDKRLTEGNFLICEMSSSWLYLTNDKNYLWFLLIPKREPKKELNQGHNQELRQEFKKEGLIELIDLDFKDQVELLEDINLISKILKFHYKFDKINIATLGNMVRQLHIHVIGRNVSDVSYPAPVWCSSVEKIPYENHEVEEIKNVIKDFLNNNKL